MSLPYLKTIIGALLPAFRGQVRLLCPEGPALALELHLLSLRNSPNICIPNICTPGLSPFSFSGPEVLFPILI